MTCYSKTSRFEPYSHEYERKYEKENSSYELPCRHCLHAFGDHYNGACPVDDDDDCGVGTDD